VTDSRFLEQLYRPAYAAAEAGRLVHRGTGGQWVIAPFIQQLARQIDFESTEGLARRWYPLGRGKPVVLDPFVSFGAPSIVGRGVKTASVHDLFVAENESLTAVRAWWNLTGMEIEAAVEFELGLAA